MRAVSHSWSWLVGGIALGGACSAVALRLATHRDDDDDEVTDDDDRMTFIDEVWPPEQAALDARPAPESNAPIPQLESESADVDPRSQRW
jgi:hypothetical protein